MRSKALRVVRRLFKSYLGAPRDHRVVTIRSNYMSVSLPLPSLLAVVANYRLRRKAGWNQSFHAIGLSKAGRRKRMEAPSQTFPAKSSGPRLIKFPKKPGWKAPAHDQKSAQTDERPRRLSDLKLKPVSHHNHSHPTKPGGPRPHSRHSDGGTLAVASNNKSSSDEHNKLPPIITQYSRKRPRPPEPLKPADDDMFAVTPEHFQLAKKKLQLETEGQVGGSGIPIPVVPTTASRRPTGSVSLPSERLSNSLPRPPLTLRTITSDRKSEAGTPVDRRRDNFTSTTTVTTRSVVEDSTEDIDSENKRLLQFFGCSVITRAAALMKL